MVKHILDVAYSALQKELIWFRLQSANSFMQGDARWNGFLRRWIKTGTTNRLFLYLSVKNPKSFCFEAVEDLYLGWLVP